MNYRIGLLALLLSGAQLSSAATIVVNSDSGAANVPGACALRDAITLANTGNPTGGCGTATAVPRDEPDCVCTDNTIELPPAATITLSGVDDAADNTGLPAIGSSLTIHGNGSTIQRDPLLACNRDGVNDAGEFALLINNTTLVLDHLTLANGCADSADYTMAKGGAISSYGVLSLDHVVLRGNYASNRGGALYTSGYLGGAGTNHVSNSTFVDNAALVGGAIFAEGTTTNLTLTATLFRHNNADPSFDGGALNLGAGTSAIVENSTFSQNSAAGGSAIAADGVVAIVSSTIADNVATGGGGALQIAAPGATQQLTIKNSLLAANSGDAGNCKFGGGLVILAGVSLSSDAGCSGFSINSTDPRLSPLAENGGPTSTYALQSGSPAVDAVVDCTDASNAALTVDQRGTTRPQGTACDIGAFELEDQLFGDGFESLATARPN